MAGRVQQQQAGGANPQDVADGLRRFLAQEGLQHRVQRAHPAQDSGGETMRGGAVPGILCGQRVQGFFQGTMFFQDRGQQVERRFSGWISHQTGSVALPMPWYSKPACRMATGS